MELTASARASPCMVTDDPVGSRRAPACGYRDPRHHGYRSPAPDSLDWQRQRRPDRDQRFLLRRLCKEEQGQVSLEVSQLKASEH